jgi:hypothetical protein
VRASIEASAAGEFLTSSGRPLTQLKRREDGSVYLIGKVDGRSHEVAQVAELLASGGGGSAEMHAAMAPDGDDWSHSDSLTCDTCHTSWNLQCIGCHVNYDLRLNQVDYHTGTITPGLTSGGRSMYSLDTVLLGTGVDGRVQTVMASQQVLLTMIGAEEYGTVDGEVLIGEEIDLGEGKRRLIGEFRHRDGLAANNGFAPFFQHTTTSSPRSCATCHRVDASDAEEARFRGVYGYGTGEFMLDAPGGEQIDGLQFLAPDGAQITTWAHEQSGPVRAEVYQRAHEVIVSGP